MKFIYTTIVSLLLGRGFSGIVNYRRGITFKINIDLPDPLDSLHGHANGNWTSRAGHILYVECYGLLVLGCQREICGEE